MLDWSDRVNLITTVTSLIVIASFAHVHLIVTGDPLTPNAKAVASVVGSVKLPLKGDILTRGAIVVVCHRERRECWRIPIRTDFIHETRRVVA